MTISEETLFLLKLSKIKGVGPAKLKKIAALPDFSSLSLEHWGESLLSQASTVSIRELLDKAEDAAEFDLREAIRFDCSILSQLDSEFPPLLKKTPDCPFFLYVRGQLRPESGKSIAIIGTREPTEHGKEITKRIAELFSEMQWSIVSGLALGCDSIAHMSALESYGHTVAVLAHGLQTVAPKQHARLAEKILDRGGALVSEYGFGVEPSRFFFVKRDRIQAGLAQGVVMIQSDEEGGSLHASRAAIEYGRTLAVPYPTKRDIVEKATKINANLILSSEDEERKVQLLKCAPADLDNLVIVRSKEDYPYLMQSLESSLSLDISLLRHAEM
ncbi:DNA-processing protein DprA [Herbaspirillum robiniae]|uniref:DNA-processing protein DprA n=1 Tax=Herbaspirillum robiniae TaxID=2014887 RepID=UPI003D7731E0